MTTHVWKGMGLGWHHSKDLKTNAILKKHTQTKKRGKAKRKHNSFTSVLIWKKVETKKKRQTHQSKLLQTLRNFVLVLEGSLFCLGNLQPGEQTKKRFKTKQSSIRFFPPPVFFFFVFFVFVSLHFSHENLGLHVILSVPDVSRVAHVLVPLQFRRACARTTTSKRANTANTKEQEKKKKMNFF